MNDFDVGSIAVRVWGAYTRPGATVRDPKLSYATIRDARCKSPSPVRSGIAACILIGVHTHTHTLRLEWDRQPADVDPMAAA